MRTGRVHLVLLASLIFMIQACQAFSQARPGIRMFVKPPEGCYVVDPVDTENVYSLIRIQIQALWLAHSGEQAKNSVSENSGGFTVARATDTISGLRKERIDNTCASFVVSYFSSSKIRTVAVTAQFLAYAYDELGRMSNQMLGITLRKSLPSFDAQATQFQLSKLTEKRSELLGNMTIALNLSLDLLIDRSRTDPQGKPDHLLLRKAQMADLLDYLNSCFPSLKNSEEGGNSGDFDGQAALIRAFLTSGYKAADVP